MLWFLILFGILFAFGAFAIARRRRSRRREARMVLGELKDFARIAADPEAAKELSFTGPHRDDDDPAHDTMFTARHGCRQLSFILDTSRWRLRWWVLAEWFPEHGPRSVRWEATFIERAIPQEHIRVLLKAARGESVLAAPPPEPSPEPPAHPSGPPPEPAVDPFDTVPDPTAQA